MASDDEKRGTGQWVREVVTSVIVSASEERREAERKDRLVIVALLTASLAGSLYTDGTDGIITGTCSSTTLDAPGPWVARVLYTRGGFTGYTQPAAFTVLAAP